MASTLSAPANLTPSGTRSTGTGGWGQPWEIAPIPLSPYARTEAGIIYVKNLDHSIDNKALYATFCLFG